MEKAFVNREVTALLTFFPIRAAMWVVLAFLLKGSRFLPAVFLLFIVLLVEASHLWASGALRRLDVNRRLRHSHLFPDEETVLVVTLENKKMLPAFLHWLQPLPPLIEPVSAADGEIGETVLGQSMLSRYSKTTAEYRIRAVKRGCCKLPALQLYSRDIFGLFFRATSHDDHQEVFVYPRLLPLSDPLLKPLDLIGMQMDKRPFLPDPVMFAGLREYTADTPARFVHWKASAHHDELLAKIIEPSADLRLLIAVDAESFLLPEPCAGRFEKALSIAATLAVWADTRMIPFGLLINAPQRGLEQPALVSLGSRYDQGRRVMEALARVELAGSVDFGQLLGFAGAQLPWGTTMILIGTSEPEVLPPVIKQVVHYSLEVRRWKYGEKA